MTSSVSTFGSVQDAADILLEKIEAKADQIKDSIEIDTSWVEDWLRGEEPTWTEAAIASAVSDLIADKASEIEQKAQELAEDLKTTAQQEFNGAIGNLTPSAQIQGDVVWQENCCDQAEWSAIAANIQGATGIDVTAGGVIELDIGGSFGVQAETKLKVEVELTGNWDLTRFNPVRPTSETGSSVTVTATPVWQGRVGGKIKVQVGIGLTIGGGVKISGTLDDVDVTLDAPCSE